MTGTLGAIMAALVATHSAVTPPVTAAPAPAPRLSLGQVHLQPDRPPDCNGCPPRRIGTSFLLVTMVNGIYEAANLIRGQDTAKITPATWWNNMKRGWEWDLDDFVVNQIGHPYQGNNYFTTGRANGLTYWESAALTAFGSGTWEYFGETNQASLNDFINTTLGGMALGEMLHRTAWLLRDPALTGKTRIMDEIAATVLDPMSGLTRFTSGDATRITEKPPDMVPSALSAVASLGALWRGSNTGDPSHTYPFFETDLLYGDVTRGTSHTPYDAFAVRLAFGGGSAISEARVRGRLLSAPFHGAIVTISQGYQYNDNPAYKFGAQSFDLNIGVVKQPTRRLSIIAAGWGGATILGGVDSIPLPAVTPHEGQGVSVGPRFYDYGPGGNAGAFLIVRRDGREVLSLAYEFHHLHVLDGVRANHILQRARLDFSWPLKGALGIGASGEFFDRRTYYVDTDDEAHFRFPQARIYLTWTIS